MTPPTMQLEFPEPAKRKRKLTQIDRVEAVMRDGQWHTLTELHETILSRYGVMDSEAGISARMRELPKRGLKYEEVRVEKGKNQRKYRVTK